MNIPEDILADAERVWIALNNQRADGTSINAVQAIAEALAVERDRSECRIRSAYEISRPTAYEQWAMSGTLHLYRHNF